MTVPRMVDYHETCRTFDWNLPETFNFGADVVDRYAREVERPALIWCNAAGAERRFTFADIKRLSDRFAHGLAEGGVRKGDRVVVMLPRLPEWQVAMVACFKLGAVAVPCIDMLTGRDLAYRIEHSGARAIVTTEAIRAKVPTDAASLALRIFLEGDGRWTSDGQEIATSDAPFEPARVGLEDPVVIYYTSGTTGNPKGVTHAARALYVWRYQARYWLDLGDGDLMWCTADTGWSKAGTSILFGPWSWGVPVLFHDGPYEPQKRLELLARYRVTVFCAAATELRRLIFEDVGAHDLLALRRTVSAGETLNPEVASRWTELTGAPTHEGYGQTESLMSVHNYPCTPGKLGSMGLPLPGYRVAVLDDNGTRAGTGETGTIAIGLPNPNLFLGYWREPGRQARSIVRNKEGEWWLTGDSGWMDADGYVFFEGRGDDIISSAGYRIGPSEVENALLEHPAVRECAAVASPDPERGEIVKAFVVLADGVAGSEDLVRDLQHHCKRTTAPYKYPREVAFVADLPKNVAGKLLRGVLKRQEYERKGVKP
ncbi:MAG: acyl-CoA synthetase [Alphaproteobacteria bacterium]